MGSDVYTELFIRLGWVVGLLATILVIGALLFAIFAWLRALLYRHWLSLAVLGSAAAFLAHHYLDPRNHWHTALITGSLSISVPCWLFGFLHSLWPALRRFVRARRVGSPRTGTASSSEQRHAALEQVLALEQMRREGALSFNWLYLQCVQNDLQFRALQDLCAKGIIQPDDAASNEPPASPSVDSPFDPYAVLKVARGASQETIRDAYRSQMKLYHPDRVHHLGPELQALAEAMTKDLQRAYEMLTADRR